MKCQYCGKTLPKGRSKYCSDECKDAYFKKKYRKSKKCENCGKELTGRQRKFCSNKCRMLLQGKLDETIKTCKVCGKLLTGNRYCFCSKECFEKAKASGRYKHDGEQRKKPKTKSKQETKKPLPFAEVCKLAREKGLSYGQYVAKYKL